MNNLSKLLNALNKKETEKCCETSQLVTNHVCSKLMHLSVQSDTSPINHVNLQTLLQARVASAIMPLISNAQKILTAAYTD